MTGADLAEWEAFELAYGPIVVHERIDVAQAMASNVAARLHGARGGLKPEDFMPKWSEQPREQSADELVEVLRGWARKKERRGH